MAVKPYLRNTWYAAAWSTEVGRTLFSRTLLEEPILLYRTLSGEPVAISNVCAHRFAPLHMGKLIDDTVQCPYHGLRYDGTGHCVLNPHGDGMIPPRMSVATYPAVERHGLIWVWMGDLDQQDPAKIPDFSCHVDPELKRVSGVIEMKANYELITDNLLDLGHAEFVHEGILSSEAITRSKLQTIQNGTTIYANRWCPNGAPAPAWDGLLEGRPAEVDHWLYMRWDAPASMLLDAGVTRVGDTRERGAWVYGTDILVPKDKDTTYYFWAVTRAYAQEDPAADAMWEMSIKGAFEGQDQVIIEAQQRMIGERDLEDCKPVMLAIDSAAQRARKLLAKLIAESAAPTPDNPPLAEQRRTTGPSCAPVQPAV